MIRFKRVDRIGGVIQIDSFDLVKSFPSSQSSAIAEWIRRKANSLYPTESEGSSPGRGVVVFLIFFNVYRLYLKLNYLNNINQMKIYIKT